jgi:hypothetical protein
MSPGLSVRPNSTAQSYVSSSEEKSIITPKYSFYFKSFQGYTAAFERDAFFVRFQPLRKN